MTGRKGLAFHENLSREHAITGSSDRSFGLTFATVFAAIAAFNQWSLDPGGALRWAIGAGGLLGIALFWPAGLAPFNRLWLRFGLLLHAIMSPIVMGCLFFGVVTPLALLMRILGKDLLFQRRGTVTSYWVPRTPPGPAPESMRNQF